MIMVRGKWCNGHSHTRKSSTMVAWSYILKSYRCLEGKKRKFDRSEALEEMIRPQEATTRGGVCHRRREWWRSIERSQLAYMTGRFNNAHMVESLERSRLVIIGSVQFEDNAAEGPCIDI